MAEESESGRKLRTKQRKKYNDQDIDEDDIDGRRMYSVEEKLLSDQFDAKMVQELKGPEFTMEWMQKNGLIKPIVFYDKTGLGLRVPSENFKVSDVKQCVGSRRMLDVMDVNTQKALEMSMKEWVKYYENPARDRLLNVISLEFCHTRLENYVESPTLVRQIDWVDRAWPKHLKECQTESTNLIEKMKYPKVQKYCLMSVAGCYTDFHVDFGGTSVWYHILHGEKIFWLAPPTQRNVDRYVEWTLSAKQGDHFLGDTLECCQRIQLKAGYTFIIPSGWIHAVYTPVDSLVFGGNFLHSFNIENQLLVARIEDKTYVPSKFKYPFYQEIMWYVVDRYLSCLTGRTYLASSDDATYGDDAFDDQGLIQVDEDSRPPSRNPDSRPPSRAMDETKSEKEEETPKLSKSVTIELTRIDANLKRSQSEDENQPPGVRPRGPRKTNSDPNAAWEGGGPKKWVHLTATEMKGVNQLIEYLSGLLALPPSKRGLPKELVDPEALLKELKQVLDEHKNDDQDLAVCGEPVIGWSESTKKQKKLKLGYKTFKPSKAARAGQTPLVPTSSSAGPNVTRRRRTRCKKCEACTRTECGECTFCKDMRKFGGPGRMKQTCISRQCMAPVLPSAAVCALCNQGDQPNPDDHEDIATCLMECGICWEIMHPKCFKKKFENLESEGVVNEDLPSSWECPRCCTEGRQGQLKARVKPGGVSLKRQRTEDSLHLSADGESSQDEEGSGPLSPRSPIEGKRVTAKEGSTKCEFGTPVKWANNTNSATSKWFSPMDSSVKKDKSRSPSPAVQRFQDENSLKNTPGVPHGHKKLLKREKSPSTPEDPSRAPRKRHSLDKPSLQQPQDGNGGKRPKRESPGSETSVGVGGHEQEGQTVKPGLQHLGGGHNPQEKTPQDKSNTGLRNSTLKSKQNRTEDGPANQSKQDLQEKIEEKIKEKLAEIRENGVTALQRKKSLPKSCLVNNVRDKKMAAKIQKRVSFNKPEPFVGDGNRRESPAEVVVAQQGEVTQDSLLNEDCVSEISTWSPFIKQFKSDGAIRSGKRPLYRGQADWGKEFVPTKSSKSLRDMTLRESGLQLRSDMELHGGDNLISKSSLSASSLSAISSSLVKCLTKSAHAIRATDVSKNPQTKSDQTPPSSHLSAACLHSLPTSTTVESVSSVSNKQCDIRNHAESFKHQKTENATEITSDDSCFSINIASKSSTPDGRVNFSVSHTVEGSESSPFSVEQRSKLTSLVAQTLREMFHSSVVVDKSSLSMSPPPQSTVPPAAPVAVNKTPRPSATESKPNLMRVLIKESCQTSGRGSPRRQTIIIKQKALNSQSDETASSADKLASSDPGSDGHFIKLNSLNKSDTAHNTSVAASSSTNGETHSPREQCEASKRDKHADHPQITSETTIALKSRPKPHSSPLPVLERFMGGNCGTPSYVPQDPAEKVFDNIFTAMAPPVLDKMVDRFSVEGSHVNGWGSTSPASRGDNSESSNQVTHQPEPTLHSEAVTIEIGEQIVSQTVTQGQRSSVALYNLEEVLQPTKTVFSSLPTNGSEPAGDEAGCDVSNSLQQDANNSDEDEYQPELCDHSYCQVGASNKPL